MQPVISGSKDWGAYEISGLAIDSIEILPENVQVLPRLKLDRSVLHLQDSDLWWWTQVDIAEGVEIRLLKIQSVFKEFQWSFSKDTFPRMKDGGTATAQMVDLSAEISFDIVTDAQKAITSVQCRWTDVPCPCAVAAQPADSARVRRVDDVVPVISLAQLNVQVGGGSHAWLYNKLLKLFGERVKTVVQVLANLSSFPLRLWLIAMAVQTEMQKSMTDGVALLKTRMTDVTRGFATGVVDGQAS